MKGLQAFLNYRCLLLGFFCIGLSISATAQFSTVAGVSDYNYDTQADKTQQIFDKIILSSKRLRSQKTQGTYLKARNELELYYITTLALKISGGITLQRAIESNYHDLIAHSRLIDHNVDLELLVHDILSYLI